MRRFKRAQLSALSIIVAALAVAAPASALTTPEFLLEGKPLKEGEKITFVSEGGETEEANFKTEKNLIQCTGVSLTGETSGPTTVVQTLFKVTKCKDGTFSCMTSGAKEGEIVSKTELGHNVYLKAEKKGPAGVLMEPASGTSLAEFKCVGIPVNLTGSVICELTPTNVETENFELLCTETGGKQTWTQVEEAGAVHRIEAFGEAAIFKIKKIKIKIKIKKIVLAS